MKRVCKIVAGGIGGVVAILVVLAVAYGAHGTPASRQAGSAAITVTGTAGLAFQGTLDVSTGASSTDHSIHGTVPATYRVPAGALVSVEVQNQRPSGTLIVTLRQGSRVLHTSTTTAPYGVVTLTTQIP